MFNHNVRLSFVVLLSLCLRIGAFASPAPAQHQAGISFTPSEDADDDLMQHFTADPSADAQSIMQDLHASYVSVTSTRLGNRCTEDNMIVRKEWGDLTPDERREYIAACKCLHDAPAKTPKDIAPGAQNRWDDFVVAHMLATDTVHRSPWLLAWHRHFIHVFEKALRDECNYTGGQPYWDYSRYLDQPVETWPIFDGSDTSLGGNGKADTPEKDCSCVTEGPFVDWKVNLGPVADNPACTKNPRDDGLGLNARCLERKFQPKLLSNLTYDNVTFTINGFNDPDAFGVRIESWPVGIHPIPHVFVGGTNSDVPASPSDAIFLCHHTMLDRVWAIWQSIDFEARTTQLASHEAYAKLRKRARSPPAPSIGMDDEIKLSPIFDSVKVRDVLSPIGGEYCYRYD